MPSIGPANHTAALDAQGATAAAQPVALPRCVVCGEEGLAPLFPRLGTPVPVDPRVGTYRITRSPRTLTGAILRCRRCGTGQLPAALVARSAAPYADAEDADYLAQEQQRVRNAHALLDYLGGSKGRLLEVGSACGFLLVAARERGFDVEGIEPSRWAAEHARRRYGLSIHCGQIEDAQLTPASFDVVVMADTIEHLRNPGAAIDRARAALRTNGLILILTPDLGSFVARAAGRFWWGLLDDHYVYFTRHSLAMLLNDHGFAVEHTAAFGRAFSVEHWTSKLIQYNEGIGNFFVRIMRATGLANRSFGLNLGDQMVCVAKKR